MSYYEDDNGGYSPDWRIFLKSWKIFSSCLGIGECGNTAQDATQESKIEMAKILSNAEIREICRRDISGGTGWRIVFRMKATMFMKRLITVHPDAVHASASALHL